MSNKFKRDELINQGLYINGKWQDAQQHFAVTNPADGNTIVEVASADKTQVESAIEAAEHAFKSWRKQTCEQRAEKLRAWFDLVMQHQQELAEIMTLEQGKPEQEAAGEIAYGASFIEWFAEEAKRIRGDILPNIKDNQQSRVIKQPVGVVAIITPWNFPTAMITRKVAPALAAGCTVVIKPPSLTPLSALALAVLAEKAGIPAGVINIVPTQDSSMFSETVCAHKAVRKLSFTGSTAVGSKLMKLCSDQIIKVSLELGGNAPFIVFDDADLDIAVEQLIACKFRNAGQTCISANRVLVQQSVEKAFVHKLKNAMQKLVVGKGQNKDSDLGPLINQDAVDKASDLVDDAISNGARFELEGGVDKQLGALFYQPQLLTSVTPAMSISKTEIFAPVVAVQTFDTEDEGIDLANDTEFGLAAYFCASATDRIHRVSEALEAGLVGINSGAISHALHPFGGFKQSGIGREGSHYGIDEYLEIKTLVQGAL
ncbi:succinate-semialdehyde dehydrogenase (NADP(+)) [Aliidiomarina minuta]|uniref:Succinate-semialdehyde dehydrogenase (NADP(+)) n=1 Tax=Aliidiomarina minuta TaxID=880057 RepID=A0A432W179_9GAMM|nr:NAD-dependent succinate-semialdehyde dehydrogenase [Aliidiomarina minuta]RUO22938.1 succinate-semialdehyde dehydrogenase (NADP(+)) [Aliidiomarina minuta]